MALFQVNVTTAPVDVSALIRDNESERTKGEGTESRTYAGLSGGVHNAAYRLHRRGLEVCAGGNLYLQRLRWIERHHLLYDSRGHKPRDHRRQHTGVTAYRNLARNTATGGGA